MRYRSLRVGSLGEWAPQLHAGLLVSGATQAPCGGVNNISRPGYHGLWRRFPDVFGSLLNARLCCGSSTCMGLQPRGGKTCRLDTSTVWACPGSLAATTGVMSVPRGTEMFQFPRCPPQPKAAVAAKAAGLPHSEIVGSVPARGSPTLIAAMPRPSSARSAEASTLCSLCLPCWNTRR